MTFFSPPTAFYALAISLNSLCLVDRVSSVFVVPEGVLRNEIVTSSITQDSRYHKQRRLKVSQPLSNASNRAVFVIIVKGEVSESVNARECECAGRGEVVVFV